MGSSNSKSEDVKTVETTENIPVEEEKTEEAVEEGVMEKDETEVEIPKILSDVINSPLFCEPGYKLDHEGKCRKLIL
ncbi:unnamed protein product [Diamesa hyperborea]